MSATIATPDSANQGTINTETGSIDLWRELLLAGDNRGTASQGMRGFGIKLTFTRDDADSGDESDVCEPAV